MLDIAQYYRTLDLEPGASPEEIHQGYLDLTWVWHPDRFAGNPRLQQKAHYKLQQINEAHSQLRSLQKASRPKNFRTRSKSQASTASGTQSSMEKHQPQVKQTTKTVEDSRSVKDCQPQPKMNNRQFDAWLD
jgi:curved DNA-binding protein CbpA